MSLFVCRLSHACPSFLFFLFRVSPPFLPFLQQRQYMAHTSKSSPRAKRHKSGFQGTEEMSRTWWHTLRGQRTTPGGAHLEGLPRRPTSQVSSLGTSSRCQPPGVATPIPVLCRSSIRGVWGVLCMELLKRGRHFNQGRMAEVGRLGMGGNGGAVGERMGIFQ
jgi:hypothetical protein